MFSLWWVALTSGWQSGLHGGSKATAEAATWEGLALRTQGSDPARPPGRLCVLGRSAGQICCVGPFVSACPAWGLRCTLGTAALPRSRRTQVEPPVRGGRCAVGFQRELPDTWAPFGADTGRGVWSVGRGSPLPTVWGAGLHGRDL
ncbi:unnamed protein product [Rangifer tarandus platyrhynchus]|uniref:Uncharacterized protein n=2 Tax=Rangifer tarandus platyrhynchus TaxID=3082113 RepID=A0ACB0EHQ1_RANTA|nr:unnamed protein product [Rangifer tarandus platyrhynchus]CAI9700247.1 unnamed protein product [Rangifer tarandus platyrhynchus]